jgi:hypothetical protein
MAMQRTPSPRRNQRPDGGKDEKEECRGAKAATCLVQFLEATFAHELQFDRRVFNRLQGHNFSTSQIFFDSD